MTDISYLQDILIVLAAALVAVPVFRRLRASAVLGYLVAGAVIGPLGLNLLREPSATAALADFGVVFLLFSVGLGLSLDRLAALRRYVFGLGSLQVVLTAVAITLALLSVGVAGPAAIVLGGGLALSSSAVTLQMLVQRREIVAPHGRVAFAVLLLQDLAVVPLLTLIPLLSDPGAGVAKALGVALLKAAIVVGAIMAAGRLALRPVLRTLAKGGDPELFTGIALLLVLGIGWATERAGLSMALGAFLAGLLIAETEYRPQIESDLQPFRGILLALFFMTVGMRLDPGLLWRNLPELTLLLGGLLLLKASVLAALCRAFGLSLVTGTRVGLMLAQGGEFGFVLFAVARGQGVLSPGLEQVAVLTVGLSMAVTPLLFAGAAAIVRHDSARPGAGNLPPADAKELEGHVLVAGFGRVGQTLALLLESRLIPYVALDLDPERVAEARRLGLPVYYGDATRGEVMKAAGIEYAQLAVVTLDQPALAHRAVQMLRALRPELPVLARARDVDQAEALVAAGATSVVPELVEGSLQLGELLLRRVGIGREEAEQVLEEFRDRTYARLSPLISGHPSGTPPTASPDPDRPREESRSAPPR